MAVFDVNSPAVVMDGAAMRRAQPELLSLALIDARNQTLAQLTQMEQAQARLREEGAISHAHTGATEDLPSIAWLVGHVGWFSEAWIARNTQRSLGMACPSRPVRLPSLVLGADAAWDPQQCSPAQRHGPRVPDLREARAYLLDTLEATLELLARATDDDAALYFYRLAMCYEDWQGEQLQVLAQAQGLPMELATHFQPVPREALSLPAMRWRLGQGGQPGFHWPHEGGELEEEVPGFEIDAQPVSWQQYAEFVSDGGYDQEALWHPVGWAWLQSTGRRAPRHVLHMGAAGGGRVLAHRWGRSVQLPGAQPIQHVSWWEADAWARWAGRRLPTEVEWEMAAVQASRAGFVWGQVWEWTSSRLSLWPGASAAAWSEGGDFDLSLALGHARVLRGASWATRARARQVRGRAFAAPLCDHGFVGFRTCAV